MPIKGLTDQMPSFPQIGIIRKGAPKEANAPGRDLTYFRVELDEQEVEAAQRFKEAYGDEPREVNVLLPFDEIDRCWEAWREAYRAGALVHRCDGEYVQYAVMASTGTVLVRNGILQEDTNGLKAGDRVPCTGKPVYHYTNKDGEQIPVHCQPRGRLRVMIPELRRVAYLTLVTGSIHDIVNISAQLKALKTLNDGKLQWLPLVLRRRPKRISTPTGSNGKRARREKWLLSIEADPRWVEAKLAELGASMLLQLPGSAVEGEVVLVEDEAEEEERLPTAEEATGASPSYPPGWPNVDSGDCAQEQRLF